MGPRPGLTRSKSTLVPSSWLRFDFLRTGLALVFFEAFLLDICRIFFLFLLGCFRDVVLSHENEQQLITSGSSIQGQTK